MKNLIFASILLMSGLCFSSCAQKGCNGGGWYGNRNLDVTSIQDKAPASDFTIVAVKGDRDNCK